MIFQRDNKTSFSLPLAGYLAGSLSVRRGWDGGSLSGRTLLLAAMGTGLGSRTG